MVFRWRRVGQGVSEIRKQRYQTAGREKASEPPGQICPDLNVQILSYVMQSFLLIMLACRVENCS